MYHDKRKYPPPKIKHGYQQRNKDNAGKYLTPDQSQETLRNYILSDGQISAGDTSIYGEMLSKFKAAPNIPQPKNATKLPQQTPQQSSKKEENKTKVDVSIKNKTFKEEVGVEDYFIYVDSINMRSDSEPSNGLFQFSLPSINATETRTDIVNVSIRDFYIPNINEFYDNTNLPDFFYYRTVYLALENFPSENAYNIKDSNRFYHFEFYVEQISSTAVRLVPRNDKIIFRVPVSNIESVNLRFYVPGAFIDAMRQIPMPEAKFTCTVESDGSSYLLLPQGYESMNQIRNSISGSGEYVAIFARYVRESLNNDSIMTNWAGIDTLENDRGLFISGVFASPNQRRIELDLGGNPFPAGSAGAGVEIIVARNRVTLQLGITTITSDTTNYTIPARAL